MRARSLSALGFLLALAFAIGLSSCSSGATSNGAQPRGFKNEPAGISLAVPQGWHATTRHFTVLLDPRERVVLTSFPVDGVTQSQGCSPDTLLRQMPRSGVAAFLLEYLDAAARRNVDPRPPRFRLGEATNPGCCFWPPAKRVRAHAINFGASGRAFQLLIAVGRGATPGSRRALAKALDSIRIESCDRPLPSESKPRCRRPLPA
jgi:hypothetical protein